MNTSDGTNELPARGAESGRKPAPAVDARDEAAATVEAPTGVGVEYEECVVSFIDVLGFREILTRPASEVLEILETLRKCTAPRAEAPPRSMDELRAVSRPFAESVSDAVVRMRVFETDNRDGAFLAELRDLLHIQIACVNSGVLIRAGVTIGLAHVGHDGAGPFFGPAMARAYEIESEEAIFPRIVVDEEAYDRFLSDDRLRSELHDAAEEQGFVDRLLLRGEDGTLYIDYLRGARSEVDIEVDYFDLVSTHGRIIREGLSNRNVRVRRKYVWLRRYHNQVVDELAGFFGSEDQRTAFLGRWDVDPIELVAAAYVED